MQIAVDTRTVDKERLVHISAGRIACAIATLLLKLLNARVRDELQQSTRLWHASHVFRAYARLDLPTFETAAVHRQLEDISLPSGSFNSVPFATIVQILGFVTSCVRAITQALVLAQVLWDQNDGLLQGGVCLASQIMVWLLKSGIFNGSHKGEHCSQSTHALYNTITPHSVGGHCERPEPPQNARMAPCY